GLLTFACVLGISERHLLHRGSTVQFVGQPYLTRFGSLFQSFPRKRQSSFHMVTPETPSTDRKLIRLTKVIMLSTFAILICAMIGFSIFGTP
ncbi:hypothetical protein, partial [Pseudomonas gessardii]|uniref:hypothetical protein n=1 Tax=Pseudomonas gessardii TaxID=78544 RepID=UPI001CA3D9D6